MAAETIIPSILDFVNDSSYPEDEQIASSNLGPDSVQQLLAELRKGQEKVKNEIRSLSQAAAPDIDTWILRAKELQADILRSRDTAREIVAEAEAGQVLKEKAQDAGSKVKLLQAEVAFQDTLAGSLEHIKYANGLLEKAREAVVGLDAEKAFMRLEDADASIAGLQAIEGSRPYEVLRKRAVDVRENISETATAAWHGLVALDVQERAVRFEERWAEGSADLTLQKLIPILNGLDLFDGLAAKLARDIDRLVLRPSMLKGRDNTVRLVNTDGGLNCNQIGDGSIDNVFKSLKSIVNYLPKALPTSISMPVSEKLMPLMASRLEEHWLEPAVPLETDEIRGFDTLLADVGALADQIDASGWQGAQPLRDWVKAAPRNWLTKRRETLLGETRSLVFSGLRSTKTVERVETQMMSTNDGLVGPDTAQTEAKNEDDWDNAWDEPADSSTLEAQSDTTPHGDEADDSAWDVEDDEEPIQHKESNKEHDNGKDNADEEEAWGWGDDDASKQSQSPAKEKKLPQVDRSNAPLQTAEREMTLREIYTVTAIPDNIIRTIKQVIEDAQTLSGPDYTSSPVAPAATALYTLPTLALAIYRATATQAYTRSDNGGMLMYNDSNRLAENLRSWQASQPLASRLRLDNDVKALEQFAKAAYSSEMESQRTILRDLLDGAQGFSNSTVQPFKGECESAVEQIVHRLRSVHHQWKSVLSQSALLQSLGSLLSTVINKMISEIEDLGDISEADSKQLKLLCENMASIKDTFRQQMPDGSEGDMTFVYCPTWLKFQYLAEILESSLADIKYLWNEGELSLEFDPEEVIELIEALFAESDIRRRTINEIRRGGRS
ncbi:hypothetical protein K431DRAFT_281066 [Polychaeton citri CBS 116435]|uniref:ZW10 C-terminal helical domain-containing protein n=1 Tax=Polychaeton citri CBS 116435 TaxID=1314669 RepID=A0A9P4QEC3_9PEZI|nr:hypothetical protein K431DRAFT_281066 [Polychaeton citri CBS 116435]